MLFSVAGLFLLANGVVLPWLKRPEAWLAALLAAMVISDLPQRLLLGRPFALTIAALMTILFVAQKSAPGWKYFLLFTAAITGCTFVHGVWYLWLLPLAAFLFAGQFRWAGLLAGAWLAGVGIAALATGHPLDYLAEAITMAVGATGKPAAARPLVLLQRRRAGRAGAVPSAAHGGFRRKARAHREGVEYQGQDFRFEALLERGGGALGQRSAALRVRRDGLQRGPGKAAPAAFQKGEIHSDPPFGGA